MSVPAGPRLGWGITAFLAVSIVAIVILALAISTLLDVRRERAAFRETLSQRAARMASTLSDVMADSIYFLDVDDLGDLVKVVRGAQDIEYVVVFDPDGKILVDSEQESRYPVGEIDDEPALNAVAAGQRVTRPGDRTLEVFAPIQIGSDVIGGVRFGYDTSPIEAEIRALTVQRIWQSSGVVAAAIVLSYLMAWYLVRPIRRLVHATQQVASGDLDFDEPVHRRDEIGDLTSAFASMTRSLRVSREALERSHRELESKVEERTQQLLAASRAKSEFVANMSHEIRTPINGVMGMTELLLGTEVTDEQREYLELTRKSSDALLEVINDVLDFSKIEAGKLNMETTDFDLHDTLADAMDLMALRAHEKELELAYDLQPDVPRTLTGDPGRLRQVLINLVGNAIKFTEQGEIVVRVEPGSKEGDEVDLHFSVADTGIGIPAEKHRSIFDAFSQADGSTTRRYGRTGLGLTVSSQLVEMMSGQIWVESDVGRGSTFHFTARFGVQTDATSQTTTDVEELHVLPVLVVDDNATNRRFLEQMITQWRMKPTTADGGKAALTEIEQALAAGERFPLILTDSNMPGMDLIDGEHFDLVVTDMMMPGVNGIEVLLAAKRVDSQYPVIIITGYPSVDMAVRLVKLGAADYITKPFNVDMIKITVAKVLTMSELSKKALQGSGSDAPATGLTEPYEPAVFDQFLEKEIARAELRGRGCCVLVARIDDFDNLPRGGLTARGSRLKTFARVLKQQARAADVIGRTGGAELSVLMPETDQDEAKVLGHAIASEVKSNFTISVGVASYPRDASGSRSLLEAARAGWEMGG